MTLAPHTPVAEAADEFLYLLTHDVKAAVRGIKSLTQWLDDDYRERLDDEGKELLELLLQRVNTLDVMFDGLLDFSRIDRLPEEPVEVDLACEIPQLIERRFRSEPCAIEIEGTLPTVVCEPRRFMQVFENLIANAVHHNDNPTIRIRTESRPTGWRFSVEDDGRGIPETQLQRIFSPLVTLSAESNHVGMGLALCKKFIERHGGHLDVTSVPGKGSCFSFTWLD